MVSTDRKEIESEKGVQEMWKGAGWILTLRAVLIGSKSVSSTRVLSKAMSMDPRRYTIALLSLGSMFSDTCFMYETRKTPRNMSRSLWHMFSSFGS